MVELEVDAVLFDNDGVLVDSHPQVEPAWAQLSAEFGLSLNGLAADVAGVRAQDSLARHLTGGRLQEAVRRLEDLEVQMAEACRALPGAVALLGGLPQTTWTIVTSASRRLALARWAAAGIPVPDETVTADDVGRGKPDPEPYAAGAAALGVPPSRCLVVEDSPAGAAAGAAAGATLLAVGGQDWDVEPVARVRDLRQVVIEPADDSLWVHIRTTTR